MGQDREIAFSTFLKLLALPAERQRATLSGFLAGRGFNYWRPLKELAGQVATGEIAFAEIESAVGRYATGHQEKYNSAALTRLSVWCSKHRVTLIKNQVHLVRKFGNSGLKVRIAPELAFSRGRRRYYMHLWATNSPVLTEDALSMGLRIFEATIHESLSEECECVIFDTVKNRIFDELDMVSNVEELLAIQREALASFWQSISSDDKRKSGGSASDEIRPPAE